MMPLIFGRLDVGGALPAMGQTPSAILKRSSFEPGAPKVFEAWCLAAAVAGLRRPGETLAVGPARVQLLGGRGWHQIRRRASPMAPSLTRISEIL